MNFRPFHLFLLGLGTGILVVVVFQTSNSLSSINFHRYFESAESSSTATRPLPVERHQIANANLPYSEFLLMPDISTNSRHVVSQETVMLTPKLSLGDSSLPPATKENIASSQLASNIVTPTSSVHIPPILGTIPAPMSKPMTSASQETSFRPLIRKHIRKGTDIAFFNGHNVPKIWGYGGTEGADAELTGRSRVRNWGDVTTILKRAHANSSALVAHLHNEFKLGDLLELIVFQHRKQQGKLAAQRLLSQEDMHRAIDQGQLPMLISNSVDENWGFLSTGIGTRTAHWLNMTNHLAIHHSNYETVQHFLSSHKVLLVTANTHVDPNIGFHSKVLCFPLGVRNRPELFELLKQLASIDEALLSKDHWLLINNSGWGDREMINDMVSRAFNRTVVNSYTGKLAKDRKTKKTKKPSQQRRALQSSDLPQTDASMSRDMRSSRGSDPVSWPRRLEAGPAASQEAFAAIPAHYMQTVKARFVLCPSGLGMDSYRLWETILLGSIPVIERNAGLDRIFSYLPVLIIDNYSELTPELLMRMYPCFIEHQNDWRFEHISYKYWIYLIRLAKKTNSIDHISANHPAMHLCDYKSFGL